MVVAVAVGVVVVGVAVGGSGDKRFIKVLAADSSPVMLNWVRTGNALASSAAVPISTGKNRRRKGRVTANASANSGDAWKPTVTRMG